MSTLGNDNQTNWLRSFLDYAVGRKLCTKIGCTTCGATEFRNGLASALGESVGRTCLYPFDRSASLGIAKALATLEVDARVPGNYDAAVRLIVYELWNFGYSAALEVIPRISYTGMIISSMRSHQDSRDRLKTDQLAEIERRKTEKERLKQAKLENRRADKAERDRIWRENKDSRDDDQTARSEDA